MCLLDSNENDLAIECRAEFLLKTFEILDQ
jgi:hypothetical protein